MTTDLVFVDTNVFLYARDDRFPAKQQAAASWLADLASRDALVVSPQILGEFLNAVLRGKIALDPIEMRRVTTELHPFSQGTTDLELVGQAWALRIETGFQWWDCVVLASANRAGCRYLLSEDYQHGRTIRGTTILNPFIVGPEAVATEH
ncbi:PIN domain-containing protein [Methylorubrum podarium]|uniref:PIN domain-containing protein n=1 Tax=Methylorubrum podarium TaxID=200476 RepID=A0ABV1QH02_9HYPH